MATSQARCFKSRSPSCAAAALSCCVLSTVRCVLLGLLVLDGIRCSPLMHTRAGYSVGTLYRRLTPQCCGRHGWRCKCAQTDGSAREHVPNDRRLARVRLPSPKGLPSRCLLGRSVRNAPRAMYDATCSMHRALCPPYCALAMQRARNRIGLAVVSVGMGRTATPAGPIISSWPVSPDLCLLKLALWVRPVDLSWLSHSVGPTL